MLKVLPCVHQTLEEPLASISLESTITLVPPKHGLLQLLPPGPGAWAASELGGGGGFRKPVGPGRRGSLAEVLEGA